MQLDIKNAIDTMRRGGVVLYPTDTIWGLGCDATNAEAVRRIFEIKKRADSKAMLVLVDSEAKLQNLVNDIPDVAFDLIELTEKPLTIVYSGAKNLAKNLIAGDGSVGIRITREQFSKTLCERFHGPIVSTSANVSGEPSPQCFAEISEEIKNAVDYIVQFRQNENVKVQPSSIVKLGNGGEIQILRK